MKNNDTEKFLPIIRAHMAEMGLGAVTYSRYVDVACSNFYMLLNGRRTLTQPTFEKLADKCAALRGTARFDNNRAGPKLTPYGRKLIKQYEEASSNSDKPAKVSTKSYTSVEERTETTVTYVKKVPATSKKGKSSDRMVPMTYAKSLVTIARDERMCGLLSALLRAAKDAGITHDSLLNDLDAL